MRASNSRIVTVVPGGPVHWATRSASTCASKTRAAGASNSRREGDALRSRHGDHGALVGHVGSFVVLSSSSSRAYSASRRRRCASSQSTESARGPASRWTGRVLPSLRFETTPARLEDLDVLRDRLQRDREQRRELVDRRVAVDEPIDDRAPHRVAQRREDPHEVVLPDHFLQSTVWLITRYWRAPMMSTSTRVAGRVGQLPWSAGSRFWAARVAYRSRRRSSSR